MLIVCPNCATSYDVDVASLRPAGRRVRCVRCRTVWDAELPHAEKLAAAADALAPAPLMAQAPTPPASAGAPPSPPTAFAEVESLPDEPALNAPPAEPPQYAAAAPEIAAAEAPPAEIESPPIVPVDPGTENPAEREGAAEAPPVEDIETIAARRQARNAKQKGGRWLLLSRLQVAILALIVVNAIIVGWRADFVRAMPQTASFYALIGLPVNLRGLKFDGLTTATEEHDGVPIFVIEGNIVNTTGKPKDVPHLRFAVRNAAHQEVYSWTAAPPRNLLAPGEAIAFHSRLASPPPDAHDLTVRFVNRYDIVTGTR